MNFKIREWNELLTRVLCDTPAKNPKLVYLHGHSLANVEPVYKVGAKLAKKYRHALIGVLDIERKDFPKAPAGLTWFHNYHNELIKRGVAKERIIGLTAHNCPVPLSTDMESYAIVKILRKMNLRNPEIIIVSCPFHQMRSIISDVSALIKTGCNARIFSVTSEALPWHEKCLGSQSVSANISRAEQLEYELGKIARYQAKGDHVPVKDVIEYLNRRGE